MKGKGTVCSAFLFVGFLWQNEADADMLVWQIQAVGYDRFESLAYMRPCTFSKSIGRAALSMQFTGLRRCRHAQNCFVCVAAMTRSISFEQTFVPLPHRPEWVRCGAALILKRGTRRMNAWRIHPSRRSKYVTQLPRCSVIYPPAFLAHRRWGIPATIAPPRLHRHQPAYVRSRST